MKRVLLVLVVVMVFVFVTSGSASPLPFQSPPPEAMSKPEFYASPLASPLTSPLAIPDVMAERPVHTQDDAPVVAPAVEVVALPKTNDFPAPPGW